MKAIKKVSGRAILLPGNDIDTDQIIPARYLKSVTFDNLGPAVFYDERFTEDGTPKEHPFNTENIGQILITGNNFGCGSSREHAPQSLMRFGVEAIIGGSFSEIFFSNALAIGLPCMTIDAKQLLKLNMFVTKNPDAALEISLEHYQIKTGENTYLLQKNDSVQKALLNGTYNSLDVLLENKSQVQKKAEILRQHNFLPVCDS